MIQCSCGLSYSPDKLYNHLRTKTHLRWATTGQQRVMKRDANETNRYKRYATSYREAIKKYRSKLTQPDTH